MSSSVLNDEDVIVGDVIGAADNTIHGGRLGTKLADCNSDCPGFRFGV